MSLTHNIKMHTYVIEIATLEMHTTVMSLKQQSNNINEDL